MSDEDRIVGSVRRDEVLRSGANFRVAHLWVFNDESELLLQRLAMDRPRHPGCWGSSVAAYVQSGETYLEAITRRTGEELGFSLDQPVFLGKTSMVDEKSLKFISVFMSHWSGPLNLDEKHISHVTSMDISDIIRVRRAEPWTFTPTFVHLLDQFSDQIIESLY